MLFAHLGEARKISNQAVNKRIHSERCAEFLLLGSHERAKVLVPLFLRIRGSIEVDLTFLMR